MSLSDLEELYTSISDYEEQPVGIEEFIESDEFLGSYFQGSLFPYWKSVLKDIYPSPIHSPYWLVCLRGSIGQGKSTASCTGVCYDLYRLLCLKSPQHTHGLIESTKIVFAIFNVTMSLATDVIWDQLSQMFIASPYFSRLLGPLGTKKKGRDTLFPKRVDFFMGSRVGHTLGKAVFDAILSEANFDVVKDQTYNSFNSILRRMESRFIEAGGGFPGKIWIDSSESDKFSVVNKIVDQYRGKKGVYISQASLWQVKPHKYGPDRFWVYKGSDVRSPEIVDDSKQDLLEHEPENCIQVPTEHFDSFNADIHAALRDLAGVSTSSSYKLFRIKDKLSKAINITTLFPDTIKLDFDRDDDQISNYLKFPNYFANCLNKNSPRNIHIDIGLTGDRLGIAASYTSNFVERSVRDVSTFEKVTESVPNIVTEWAIGIEPTPGKQVPLYKIRLFISWLSNQGYIIGKITADGYQSADMIQSFQKMGYSAEVVSLDRTSLPYIQFRNAVYEGRWMGPKSSLLTRELLELEVSPDGEKIDHPIKNTDGTDGSKDVSDAVGGSVYGAMKDSSSIRLLHYIDKESYSESTGKVKNIFWPGME